MYCKIIFKRTIESVYEVSKFYEGHSNGLVTSRRKQFLRSVRSVKNVHKDLWFFYIRANVEIPKIYQIPKKWVGSYENIGFTQR